MNSTPENRTPKDSMDAAWLLGPRPELSIESRERWFFDAVEGELSDSEMEALKTFLALHPELFEEWESWKGAAVTADENLSYGDLSGLLREEEPVATMTVASKRRGSRRSRKGGVIIPFLAVLSTAAAAMVAVAIFQPDMLPAFDGQDSPVAQAPAADAPVAKQSSGNLEEIAEAGSADQDATFFTQPEEQSSENQIATVKQPSQSSAEKSSQRGYDEATHLLAAVEESVTQNAKEFANASEDASAGVSVETSSPAEVEEVKVCSINELGGIGFSVALSDRESVAASLQILDESQGVLFAEEDKSLLGFDGAFASWLNEVGTNVSDKTRNTASDVASFMSGEHAGFEQTQTSSLPAQTTEGKKDRGFRIGRTTFEFERRRKPSKSSKSENRKNSPARQEVLPKPNDTHHTSPTQDEFWPADAVTMVR